MKVKEKGQNSGSKAQIFIFEGISLLQSVGRMLGLQRSFSCGDLGTFPEVKKAYDPRNNNSDSCLLHIEHWAPRMSNESSKTLSVFEEESSNLMSSSILPSPDAELVKVQTFF